MMMSQPLQLLVTAPSLGKWGEVGGGYCSSVWKTIQLARTYTCAGTVEQSKHRRPYASRIKARRRLWNGGDDLSIDQLFPFTILPTLRAPATIDEITRSGDMFGNSAVLEELQFNSFQLYLLYYPINHSNFHSIRSAMWLVSLPWLNFHRSG